MPRPKPHTAPRAAADGGIDGDEPEHLGALLDESVPHPWVSWQWGQWMKYWSKASMASERNRRARTQDISRVGGAV